MPTARGWHDRSSDLPNVWTVTFNMQFLQPYGAPVNVYVDAYDAVGNTGWPVLNSLSFTGVTTPTPSTVSVISAQGMSLQDNIQVFSVKLRDTAGGIAIYHGELLFLQGSTWTAGPGGSVATRCRVGAEMTADIMWVESSSGAYAPSLPIGSGSAQAGPNCTLYPQYSSIVQTGENTMEVRFAISFPSQFAGRVLQDHMYTADTLGQWAWDVISDPHWNWYVWPSSGWGSPPTLPSAFTTCIVTPYCSYTLPAATDAPYGPGNVIPYWIDSTVAVTAPGVTITGASGAALQRDPNPPYPASGFPGASPLMQITDSATGFSMSNLTILGNQYAIGPTTNSQTLRAYNTQRALNRESIQVDLWVDGQGANLTGNNFYDAPGFGVYINSAGSSANDGSNITVSGGVASNANQAGIVVGGAANLPLPCTTASAYTGPGVPTNITITGVTLQNSSGGPIVVGSGYLVSLIGNMIHDHQLEPPSPTFESAGGGIVVGPCVADVLIANNTIDDTYVGTPGAQGMELHGINMRVENNSVTNTPAEGIYMDATCGTSLWRRDLAR
jgi:Right handed beta helix region